MSSLLSSRLAAALLLVSLWPASRPAARQDALAVIDFAELESAYLAGDRTVVSTRLNSSLAVAMLRPSIPIAVKLGDKQTRWKPARSAFLLEVAIAASLYSKKDVVPALSQGRLEITERQTPLGGNAAEDAFERQWHRLAMAVLQRVIMPDAEQVYLDLIERRYVTGPAGTKLNQPVDPRLVLDRAIADEQAAWQAEFPAPGSAPSTRLSAVVKPGDTSKLGKLLSAAIKSSDEAAALPEVANEALIRGAVLRLRTGRAADALTLLRKVSINDADRVQQYWASLVEARALHELKRLPDAERAYRETAVLWPEATSPPTGLALVLFEMNRREDAIAAVTAARTAPAGADPWWSYMLADGRFITRWRDALREMIK